MILYAAKKIAIFNLESKTATYFQLSKSRIQKKRYRGRDPTERSVTSTVFFWKLREKGFLRVRENSHLARYLDCGSAADCPPHAPMHTHIQAKTKVEPLLMANSHFRVFFSQQEIQDQLELQLFYCKIAHTKPMVLE